MSLDRDTAQIPVVIAPSGPVEGSLVARTVVEGRVRGWVVSTADGGIVADPHEVLFPAVIS